MPYKPDQMHIAENAEQLFLACATDLVAYARQCAERNDRFSMALAGGSTPKQLYLLLSSPPLLDQMPWAFCHFYFGDERMVAHTHSDSNFAMAKQALFEHTPVPAQNIHAIPTDCAEAQQCAADYAQQLSDAGSLDLVLLGMGQDGHTASLFPNTDILDETDKLVAAVYVDKLKAWRISLTYPYINRSRRVMVLTQGASKAEIVQAILNTDTPEQYPVCRLRPADTLEWYLDRDAYPEADSR